MCTFGIWQFIIYRRANHSYMGLFDTAARVVYTELVQEES